MKRQVVIEGIDPTTLVHLRAASASREVGGEIRRLTAVLDRLRDVAAPL